MSKAVNFKGRSPLLRSIIATISSKICVGDTRAVYFDFSNVSKNIDIGFSEICVSADMKRKNNDFFAEKTEIMTI